LDYKQDKLTRGSDTGT